MYPNTPSRIDKRICKMNMVASEEDANFTKLTAFATDHPLIWKHVYGAFLARPDFRFGDTLLIFCDGVKHKRIVLN